MKSFSDVVTSNVSMNSSFETMSQVSPAFHELSKLSLQEAHGLAGV